MSSRPTPVIYEQIILTLGEDLFTKEIPVRDSETNSAFDLTPYTTITLFQKSTDYANNFPVGGITLTRKAPFTDGILEYPVTSANIPTPAGQYYGKVDFTDGSEIVKSNQFDITVKRTLTS